MSTWYTWYLVPGIHWVHKCCPLCTVPHRFHHCSLDDHRRHVIWMITMIIIILMIMVIGDFSPLSEKIPKSCLLLLTSSLMIMIWITCQYTGHCCRWPLSLHKQRVAGRWQQHLGRVHIHTHSGDKLEIVHTHSGENLGWCATLVVKLSVRIIATSAHSQWGQTWDDAQWRKTLKVQQNPLEGGFSQMKKLWQSRGRERYFLSECKAQHLSSKEEVLDGRPN